MPSLGEHHASSITKMLLIGDSGTGKTGALASLVRAGYSLHILDVDNGLDILLNLLRFKPGTNEPDPKAKEYLSRVWYETCTERFENRGGKPVPKTAQVWADSMALMDKWPATGKNIETLGPKDIFVIDSLTLLSRSALFRILKLQNRLTLPAQIQDWGDAMADIENLLGLLYSEAVKCNVIITSHITYISNEETNVTRAYPNTLGQKLPPKVGRYFNAILGTRTIGTGPTQKRVIDTVSQGLVELKNPSPHSVKPQYELATGLAEYFRDVLAS